MYKIGIIGCGKIAQIRHIPEYMERKDVKLVGFFDLNEERAKLLAEQFGGRAYKSYQEMLEDESIDAVSVCSSNQTHAEITIAALKLNKHVLCEKPMAITLEECKKMVEVSKETEKLLMIGHNQRLTKAHKKAKELIVSGEIGDIVSFRTTFGHSGPETWSIDPGKDVWFFDKKQASLGAMGDLGIHKTDLIQFLTGQKVKEVIAKVTTLDKKDSNNNLISVDDNAMCIYTMENGITGTMTASWTFYGEEDNSTILYGTKGIMKLYQDPHYSIKVIRKNETICYELEKIQTNDKQTSSGVIDAFVEFLNGNITSAISGEEALSAMAAVFASVESSKTGKVVIIE